MAIITIGGHIGAGKTTLAKKLAAALGYEELHMGAVFRELAAERNMKIQDFYEAIKKNPSIDRELDERQGEIMRQKDNIVVQGRMAWFFAKDSPFTVFNIFLAVDPDIGAKRAGKRQENEKFTTKEMVRVNAARQKSELERYRELYGVDNFLDLAHYDFVLDTSHLKENEVLERIVQKTKDRLGENA